MKRKTAPRSASASKPATRQGKGASRTSDIPPEVLAALSRGEIESATLTEGLAVDQYRLLTSVLPALPAPVLEQAKAASQLGILKRMMAFGQLLWTAQGEAGLRRCCEHASDTVRGWACFMVGARDDLSLAARLAAIRPLADDPHFGVREWAWMALRPHLAASLDEAIARLMAWATDESAYVRRFATESIRPRGVWCAHLTALKQEPQRALPLLALLRADPAVYVQDSVANWLNDAAKDNPDWVRVVCADWLRGDPSPETRRICRRAMRSLG
ncbi:MAG: HEAT repeat domain-containing protein [Lautropia sp.]|nr:HEAT repeat domain-containing protein [Lautropia sp.]